MKKIIIFLVLILFIPSMSVSSSPFPKSSKMESGVTYYVDYTNGSDSNLGTSPEEAFKTISRAEEFFEQGNTILFKRGEIWRKNLYLSNSGSESNPITFGAYGSGDKPLFLGSVTKNNASDWIKIEENLWATANGSFPEDVGFMLLGSEDIDNVGIKKDFLEEVPSDANEKYGDWYIKDGVDSQKEYWYDEINLRVILFGEQNPALNYSNIEIASTKHMIHGMTGIKYITIKNLEIKYFNAHGITFLNSQGIIIKDCDISYGGGTYLEKKVRYGNGIEFWDNAANCRVEGCKIGMMYDAAVTNQGTTENHVAENISYIGNIFWNCEYSFEAWARPSSATIKNVFFENNTCLGAGFGWGHSQRHDPHGWHMAFWGNEANVESILVRFNVFYESIASAFFKAINNVYEGLILDYNYYYETAGNLINYEEVGNTYTMDQFSQYQNDKGQDLHSVAGDKDEIENAARSLVREGDLEFLNTLLEDTHDLAIEYSDKEVNPREIIYGPDLFLILITSTLGIVFFIVRKIEIKTMN